MCKAFIGLQTSSYNLPWLSRPRPWQIEWHTSTSHERFFSWTSFWSVETQQSRIHLFFFSPRSSTTFFFCSCFQASLAFCWKVGFGQVVFTIKWICWCCESKWQINRAQQRKDVLVCCVCQVEYRLAGVWSRSEVSWICSLPEAVERKKKPAHRFTDSLRFHWPTWTGQSCSFHVVNINEQAKKEAFVRKRGNKFSSWKMFSLSQTTK